MTFSAFPRQTRMALEGQSPPRLEPQAIGVEKTRSAFEMRASSLVTIGIFALAIALSREATGTAAGLSRVYLMSTGMATGFMALFYALERVRPAGPSKPVSDIILNFQLFAILNAAAGLAGICAGYITNGFRSHYPVAPFDLHVDARGEGIRLILAFLVSHLVFDFFYYWRHRLQHVFPILWQQHKLHHMDERLSTTTRGRADWGEQVLNIFTIYVPMSILFKLGPAATGALGLLLTVVNEAAPIFYHSNLRLYLGWAAVLFVGPQVHRIHHSRLQQHRDKNFSAYFPIWDLLFGTYYHPKRDEYPPCGVEGEPDVHSFGDSLLVPFRGWRRMLLERNQRRSRAA